MITLASYHRMAAYGREWMRDAIALYCVGRVTLGYC